MGQLATQRMQLMHRSLSVWLGRGPGADALDLVPADNVHADLDLRVQRLHLTGQDLFDGLRIHRLAQEAPAGFAMVVLFVQCHGVTSH